MIELALVAAIDWSYALLAESKQPLFDRLSVFAAVVHSKLSSGCAPESGSMASTSRTGMDKLRRRASGIGPVLASTVPVSPFRGYRFPPEIIGHAVSLYHRIPSTTAKRGIQVTYEGAANLARC